MKIHNQQTKLFMLVSLALLGCSDGDTNNETEMKTASQPVSQIKTNQYEPDPMLLSSTAATSKQLHVKPKFAFKTSSAVTLDLSGNDVFGASLATKTVKVYALKSRVSQYDEQAMMEKSLLATTRFNSAGQLGLNLDVPAHYKTLLISVDGMLENNHLLVPVEKQSTISHQFY
ncbi:hypothetical protein J8Z24_03560 [Pseudoalteromonas sp. SCSIO 43201]|uniref:hypothetical protein n=1 Tax=Pseudoalteromonas TaxID=53246 RepID=UPI00207562D6|nr:MULTISPECIES: hypothetical protein [Pseudoalteromonas]MDW7549542.1 hypothetical protein [Pseudoalteromonas peptidolytica]USD29183.1 hypothetical protein J8Z24_03560 [Pseudoalteromonas sp. SCSIO 43201]